ncbi:MAG: hypothetical protein ACR2PZ_01380 [Pseudomonadales bacterium]
MQRYLLIAWVAFVCLLPQNLYGLSALLVLVPLWGLALIVAGWNVLQRPEQRKQALKVITAFPLAVIAVLLLDKVFGLPLAAGDLAGWLFVAVLSAYPLFYLGRWLLGVTEPGIDARVRLRLGDLLLLGLVGTLVLQMLFLVFAVANGESISWLSDVFGNDWYEQSLWATVVAAGILAVVGIPFALLGLIRGTRHRGMMVIIFVCFAFLFVCGFGFFILLAALAVG